MLKNETIHSLITYLQIILITNKLLVSQYLIWHERNSVSAKMHKLTHIRNPQHCVDTIDHIILSQKMRQLKPKSNG